MLKTPPRQSKMAAGSLTQSDAGWVNQTKVA
jgi:hypothetical protein